jgi:hypothetical protein
LHDSVYVIVGSQSKLALHAVVFLQAVFGLERAVDMTIAKRVPAIAYATTVAIRFINNVIGERDTPPALQQQQQMWLRHSCMLHFESICLRPIGVSPGSLWQLHNRCAVTCVLIATTSACWRGRLHPCHPAAAAAAGCWLQVVRTSSTWHVGQACSNMSSDVSSQHVASLAHGGRRTGSSRQTVQQLAAQRMARQGWLVL